MELGLLTLLDCELRLGCRPHSEIVASASDLVFYLLVLDNLTDTALEDWDSLWVIQILRPVGELAQPLQEVSGVVLDLVFEGLTHACIPNKCRVLIVVSPINLKESLVVIIVQILDEGDR